MDTKGIPFKIIWGEFFIFNEKNPRNKCITQTVCCNIDTDDVIISTSSNDTNLNIKIQELSFEKVLENFGNIK